MVFDVVLPYIFPNPLHTIQAVVETGTPTVVVLINSGGLAAEWVYANVPAVVEAYYPVKKQIFFTPVD